MKGTARSLQHASEGLLHKSLLGKAYKRGRKEQKMKVWSNYSVGVRLDKKHHQRRSAASVAHQIMTDTKTPTETQIETQTEIQTETQAETQTETPTETQTETQTETNRESEGH